MGDLVLHHTVQLSASVSMSDAFRANVLSTYRQLKLGADPGDLVLIAEAADALPASATDEQILMDISQRVLRDVLLEEVSAAYPVEDGAKAQVSITDLGVVNLGAVRHN